MIWSLAALLLFGGVFTALAGGAVVFLAEKLVPRNAPKKGAFQDLARPASSKSGKSGSANPFSRLDRDQQGFDANEDIGLNIDLKELFDFRSRAIGDQTADDGFRGMERKSRQADGPAFSGFNQKARDHRAKQ